MVEIDNKEYQKLLKANRALKVLSRSNQALIHAEEESKLLRQVCQIAVDSGYLLAWVGYAEDDEKRTVRPVAQFGYEDGYLEILDITWADTERGRGPTGTAIRTAKPAICNNIQTDPQFSPWRKQAIKRGYASSIAFPLVYQEKRVGALNIYAREPDAFDEEEVRLLGELASDLTYGIVSLHTAVERKRAEEKLKKRLEELEIFHKATVGRELKMIELEKEVNSLLKELGREPKYKAV